MSASVGTAGRRAAVDRPRLVFFFSPRSGRSRQVDALLAQVLQRRQNHSTFQLHHVDVDQASTIADRLQVTDTPALLVIESGRIRARVVRPNTCREIEEVLSPWLR
jgi:thioredoxin-like negative regulator of GroEL